MFDFDLNDKNITFGSKLITDCYIKLTTFLIKFCYCSLFSVSRIYDKDSNSLADDTIFHFEVLELITHNQCQVRKSLECPMSMSIDPQNIFKIFTNFHYLLQFSCEIL